jgi:hypothetical protein
MVSTCFNLGFFFMVFPQQTNHQALNHIKSPSHPMNPIKIIKHPMFFPMFFPPQRISQENFMVTVDGRLVHVDFGWALGKEPLDAMLIHFAVQGRHLVIHGHDRGKTPWFTSGISQLNGGF